MVGKHVRGTRPWALVCLLTLVYAGSVPAADEKPLPNPLTLKYALSLADAQHPVLEQAQADVAGARAEVEQADAQTGLNLSVEGRARWIDPPTTSPDQSNEDHSLSLILRKNLYDFGRSSASRSAAEADVQSSQWRYLDARAQHRLAIMRRFFDVLIADLQFARDDEAMAVAYVNLDKLRKRNELGQISDIDVAEEESAYQKIRRQRAVSETRKRATRALLANLLNRPGDLPSTLVTPELPQLKRELPPYDALLKKALADNPALQAIRAEVTAAGERVEAARAGARPRLNGEVEASTYSRNLGSNDPWRAGVYVQIPLYTGGSVDASIAAAEAKLHKLQAKLRQAEQDVRQAVLDRWLEASTLKVKLDEVAAQQDYRELYLDRSRTIYEQEVKTDLGDAMVQLTATQLEAAKTRFQAALDWAQLDALTGGPLAPVAASDKNNTGTPAD